MQDANKIGDKGCKELVTVLPKLVNLQSLDLVREMDGLGVLCVMLGVLLPH